MADFSLVPMRCHLFTAARLLLPIGRDAAFPIPNSITWFFGATFPAGAAAGTFACTFVSLSRAPCIFVLMRRLPLSCIMCSPTHTFSEGNTLLWLLCVYLCPSHASCTLADRLRGYFKQLREATISRLLDQVYFPDGSVNKYWIAYAAFKGGFLTSA